MNTTDFIKEYGFTPDENHPPREQCDIPECIDCGIRDCPNNEPLHYDKDGCPACSILK